MLCLSFCLIGNQLLMNGEEVRDAIEGLTVDPWAQAPCNMPRNRNATQALAAQFSVAG